VNSVPTMAPERVIVDDVAAFLKRFVFLQRECMYRLVALWIIATHLHQSFQYMGYLFIHSPEKQCGKTRLLEILHLLVHRSTGIDSSPTAAVVSRTAWGNTQLLDEGDGWPDLSGLRNILNAGFQRNGQTSRCQQDSFGAQVPKKLLLYCPRAIAGIGKDILSGTTRDRTFFVEMSRQKPGERRERLRERIVEPQAAKVKREIEEWCKSHREQVVTHYDSLTQASLSYLEAFWDRTVDISEPLGVILEVAYADRTDELAQARRELCEAVAIAREETNQHADDHRLLSAIDGIMEGEELIEQPSVLVHLLNGSAGGVVNEFSIGETLRRYGFPQKSVRKDGGQPRRCYVIARQKLRDTLTRYA